MLTEKIALVTGASRGIGKGIAQALGVENATVIGTATSQSGADAIAATFAENNIKGTGMVLNVADSESVTNCLKQITEEFGAPDILVNNAGITRDTLLMMMKDEQWEDIINTNLSSVFRMSKAVLPVIQGNPIMPRPRLAWSVSANHWPGKLGLVTLRSIPLRLGLSTPT